MVCKRSQSTLVEALTYDSMRISTRVGENVCAWHVYYSHEISLGWTAPIQVTVCLIILLVQVHSFMFRTGVHLSTVDSLAHLLWQALGYS